MNTLWQALDQDQADEPEPNVAPAKRQDRDSRKPGGLFPEQTTDRNAPGLGRVRSWGGHKRKKGRRR